MKTSITTLTLLATILTSAQAAVPPMGGEMKHIMVHLHGSALEGHVDHSIPTPVLTSYGETYTGNASVLNGTLFNAQYGWMAEGFWTPPAGSTLWLEQVSATPGLRVYEGGMMSMAGMHTFAPIFGTDASSPRIAWDGMMLHNWYAADTAGSYSATYRIYFGDDNGVAIDGYEADEVTLEWTAVPAPASLGLASLGALTFARRRRDR
ncbi:MAG TPA: PEP-CTERM sorting domain-containing protein [Phycisphaerales bacterium]|nr:PEP-CTERM sorting domain-containing protein [Phycisphaerales bacterium]